MAIASRATSAAAEVLVSLALENFTQGGLIDDIDVEVTDAATVMFDYNGQQEASPSLCLELTDANGDKHEQYWGAGKAEDWAPDSQHRGFVSQSGKTGINNQTNLFKLLNSLVEQGFPADQIAAGDLKCLIGLKMHINRLAVERTGLKREGKNADRQSTVLICSKIHSLPGATSGPAKAKAGTSTKSTASVSGSTNGAAKTAVAAKAEPAATSAGGDGDVVDQNIYAAILSHLAENEGPVPVKEVSKIVMNFFGQDEALKKLANKAVARSANPSFRKTLPDNGIAFTGTEVSLAE